MLEVVAAVRDHQEPVLLNLVREAHHELRPTDPAGERHDTGAGGHRNRSCSSGRTRSAAVPRLEGAAKPPRTSTTGRPSSACPCKSEARLASWSASAASLSCKASRPQQPIAVPTWPRRQARPTLSLTITPTWQPLPRASAVPSLAQLAS